MPLRSLLLALLVSVSSLSQAQTPKDQTEALSDLSQMFYEDGATFGREHLDRRRLDFSLQVSSTSMNTLRSYAKPRTSRRPGTAPYLEPAHMLAK